MREKAVFSSHDLPAHLDAHQRFKLWYELFVDLHGQGEIEVIPDRPFKSEIEVTHVGQLSLAIAKGTIASAHRTRQIAIKENRDDFAMAINLGNPVSFTIGQREAKASLGGAFLLDYSEGGKVMLANGSEQMNWANIIVPRALLKNSVANASDLIAKAIPPGEAMQLLIGYLRLLQRQMPTDPDVVTHAAQTVVDLIAVAGQAKGEAAEMAGMRGIRVARLQAVLSKIRSGFTDPLISAQSVGDSLGLSERYVHLLLQETGVSFTERVLELRLQRTQEVLSDRRNASMRISEIAYAAGFSDISYFNHSFRRRYGTTPSSVR
ncbi:MAG TPA: helix-turn-helix domain-containing protein [Devosiaceae bacterium]